VALDRENYNQAYLCGRLFAVLEKIQQEAAKGKLNSTIKDKYFASAAGKPATIFPKLMQLSEHHMKKLESWQVANNKKWKDEIIGGLVEFPGTLSLEEQGKFIIGYYHQERELWKKKEQ